MKRLFPLAAGGFDQLISAATNLLFALAASRLLSSADFGRFSIAALTYGLIGLLTYSLVTEPAIRVTKSRTGTARQALPAAYSTCTIIGLVGFVAGIAVALSGTGRLGAGIATVLVGALGVSLHETQRMLEISLGRVKTATTLDVAWLAISTAILGLLVLVGRAPTTPAHLIAVWFSGAWLSSLSLCLLQRVSLLAFRRALSFLRRHRQSGMTLSLEGLLGIGLAQATLMLTANAFGYELVASVALVQLAFSAASFATSAVRTLGQPRYAARHAAGLGVHRIVYLTCAVVALIVAANALTLIVLPDVLGELLFGQQWRHIEDLAIIGAIYMSARTITAAPVLALRVLGQGGAVLGLRLVTGLMQILAVLAIREIGLSGTETILAALAGAAAAVASVWLLTFRCLQPGDLGPEKLGNFTSEGVHHEQQPIS